MFSQVKPWSSTQTSAIWYIGTPSSSLSYRIQKQWQVALRNYLLKDEELERLPASVLFLKLNYELYVMARQICKGHQIIWITLSMAILMWSSVNIYLSCLLKLVNSVRAHIFNFRNKRITLHNWTIDGRCVTGKFTYGICIDSYAISINHNF